MPNVDKTGMCPVVQLAHAASCRATLTSAAEWQRLAIAAVAEHDRVRWELAELKRRWASAYSGPRFQGMTELA